MLECPENLNLIDLNDYPVSWWMKLLELGHEIKENPQNYSESCKFIFYTFGINLTAVQFYDSLAKIKPKTCTFHIVTS